MPLAHDVVRVFMPAGILRPATMERTVKARSARAGVNMSVIPTRITQANLLQTVATFAPEIRANPDWTTWTLATSVIGHFLGKDWVKANIPHREGADSTGFFQVDFSSIERRDAKSARMLDFAETLFNLQHVSGFDDRIAHMRTADAEAALAELDLGRFLYIHGIGFRFVVPTGQRGQDYDCAVTYADQRTACADAKCRTESSEMRPEHIRHSLQAARKKNLPKDEPGIAVLWRSRPIFCAVPSEWFWSCCIALSTSHTKNND
jgi:hypothetical protein